MVCFVGVLLSACCAHNLSPDYTIFLCIPSLTSIDPFPDSDSACCCLALLLPLFPFADCVISLFYSLLSYHGGCCCFWWFRLKRW